MANGIRTSDPRGFNKGRSSKFRECSRVPQTHKEGWRTYRQKRCGNNNKDEDNSSKNLNDKNQLSSSQKFRQPSLYIHICKIYPYTINVCKNFVQAMFERLKKIHMYEYLFHLTVYYLIVVELLALLQHSTRKTGS